MRIPRTLRTKRAKKAVDNPDRPSDAPSVFHATDGYSNTERVSRYYEYGDWQWPHSMPIVTGFRPNEERR